MKVGLLGTGFGIAHARMYHTHPQVSQVVVFGRTPAKLQPFTEKFGYATTTDLSSIYDDPAVELVDVCLPTRLHAEHVSARWMPASTLPAADPVAPGSREPARHL
jgi:UDP-N-acetylglucosamine 3-dehydrogenase